MLKRYSPTHSCPNTPWVSWVSLGLFYLCIYLLLCIYYLLIVSITSKSVVKGPFTISWCLTRLYSPLSARILKSLFSSYSQSFRRTVEYNLGNLLATGLFKSWKKWPCSCFLEGSYLPTNSKVYIFLWNHQAAADSTEWCWEQEHKECWQGWEKRLSKGLNLKKASIAYTECLSLIEYSLE